MIVVFDSVSVVDDLITVVFTTSGLPANAGIQLRLESALFNSYPETGSQVFGGIIPLNTTVTRSVILDRDLYSKFITGRAGINPNKINIHVKVTASQPEGSGVMSRYGAGHTRNLVSKIVSSGLIVDPFTPTLEGNLEADFDGDLKVEEVDIQKQILTETIVMPEKIIEEIPIQQEIQEENNINEIIQSPRQTNLAIPLIALAVLM